MSFLFCCCFSTYRRRIEKLTTPLDTRHRAWWIRILTSTIARVYKVSFEKRDAFQIPTPQLLGRHCLFCVLQISSHAAREHHRVPVLCCAPDAIVTRVLCFPPRAITNTHTAGVTVMMTATTRDDNKHVVNDKFSIFRLSNTKALWAVERLWNIDLLLLSVKTSFYFVNKIFLNHF